MNSTTLSIIEIFVSLVVETLVLGGLFAYLNNRSNKEQAENIKSEMVKIENEIKFVRDDIISQIKEVKGNWKQLNT